MSAPLLRLDNINKSFAAIRAVVDVSFELLPGEVHALVGENGAGKSTLVGIITGAQRPGSGTIELNGQLLRHLTPVRARQLGVACIYQHPSLFPDLSVAENIALRLEQTGPFRRIDWKKQYRTAQDLLDSIGADIRPEARAGQLSMPHQQLVEIACALGASARIVIMDEPTSSLTQREQHHLFDLVRKLRQRGAGIIYVSHKLEEIFELADRITVLRDGQRVCTCPAGKLNESLLIRLMVGREVSSVSQAKSTTGQVVLRVLNLGCSVSGLQNISFELRAGEILGVAGLVGAGRTQLAETLFGLTPADNGQIQLDGSAVVIDSPTAAVAHGIAYVPEDRVQHGVILELPIEQNVTMASHQKFFTAGLLRPRIERQIAWEYIRALDIRPAIPQALVSSLSGGNQQKVALARWLAVKPNVLILDEPTQGVDVGAKGEIHNIIRQLANQGIAVLLISSDLPELLALSYRIGVMRGGKLVSIMPAKADPHEIMAAAFGQAPGAS